MEQLEHQSYQTLPSQVGTKFFHVYLKQNRRSRPKSVFGFSSYTVIGQNLKVTPTFALFPCQMFPTS